MNRDTIIAFILIGIILIFTQTSYYKKWVMPKSQSTQQGRVVEDTLRKMRSERPSATSRFEKAIQEKKTEPPKKPVAVKKENLQLGELLPASVIGKKARTITVETPLYQAKISSRGATISSWKLKEYNTFNGTPVQLILGKGYDDLGLLFFVNNDTVDFGNVNYNLSLLKKDQTDSLVVLNDAHPTATLLAKLTLKNGQQIIKKFVFYKDKYNINFVVNLKGFDSWVDNNSYYVTWKSGLHPTEKRLRDDEGYSKVYSMLGKELDEFSIGNKPEYKKKKITGSVIWTAVRTKYFTSAIILKGKQGRGVIVEGRGVPFNKKNVIKRYSTTVEMPLNSGTVTADSFTVYIGPLEYNTIRKLGVKLDKVIMSSGWYERLFRPFSIAILVSFKFLHRFIPNYGWVIVVFSLLIKIVVYPLTHKSYVSMKKMQLVQPLMAEIKEKYKNDPQRMNKETMKLYKEYGVNPMGGCLPTLLQMPLLVGLFIVFRSTIELRGAQFLWWIKDLSMPDTIATLPFTIPMYGNTINVLPIVMGFTMYFQQKMTTQDPKQKSLTYLMPVFFVLLFNSFPSGLNLYYTLFNILTIAQQHFVKTDKLEIKPVKKKTPRQRSHKKGK
ncbi:MAG: membrane protein insertase YidC [Calditrichaeota bacterium]|nr:membrane protein insertase YidC [Calditrichota bacterium]